MTPPPTALTSESWKWIPGSSKYQVSDRGRVQNHDTLHVLKQATDKDGYKIVSLSESHRKHPTKKVHVLVLLAFIGPCPPRHEGGHLNGDPGDNRLENLAWVTRKQNAKHRAAHGRTAKGERHGSARLTAEQVRQIRDHLATGLSQKDTAASLGVSVDSVWRIANRKNWAHV